MTARERSRLMAALLGLLIFVSLVACSSHDGSVPAAALSSSVQRSILTSSDTTTPGPTTSVTTNGSSSASSLATTSTLPTAAGGRSTGPTDTGETTVTSVTSAGSCPPSIIVFEFEPVEPTFTYPYPQEMAVVYCTVLGDVGTITMQVGDTVRMTAQPGVHPSPLSATPHELVTVSGNIILARHPGTAHIYTGQNSVCRLLGLFKSSHCELLTLKIGSRP